MYFQHAALSKISPPNFLFLPTSFFAHADLMYTENQTYTDNIHALRRHVLPGELAWQAKLFCASPANPTNAVTLVSPSQGQQKRIMTWANHSMTPK